MNTNMALQLTEDVAKSVKELNWNYFVNEISKVFKLSKKEYKELDNSITAKIIATIPFAANCSSPERTATAHLCLYMAEKRGFQEYCAHLPSDDANLLKRLDFISTFEDGDQLIIEHGMHILALIMLEGYYHSATKDNPIVSGVWNYEQKKNEIVKVLRKIKVSELDDLADEVFAMSSVW